MDKQVHVESGRGPGSHLSKGQRRAACPGEEQMASSRSCGLRGGGEGQDTSVLRCFSDI